MKGDFKVVDCVLEGGRTEGREGETREGVERE